MKYEELAKQRVETVFQADAKLRGKKEHNMGLAALRVEVGMGWAGRGEWGQETKLQRQADHVTTGLWFRLGSEDKGYVRIACELPWCGGGLE